MYKTLHFSNIKKYAKFIDIVILHKQHNTSQNGKINSISFNFGIL